MKRAVEGVFGDEVVGAFRRPLEVRAGTLVVGFVVVVLSAVIIVLAVQRRLAQDFPGGDLGETAASLPRDSLAPGTAGADAGITPSGSSLEEIAEERAVFRTVDEAAIPLPDAHLPDPNPLPDIREVSGAGDGPPVAGPDARPSFLPAGNAEYAGRWFIQVHSFLDDEICRRLAEYIADEVGLTSLYRLPMYPPGVAEQKYKLFIGPYDSSQATEDDERRLKRQYRMRPLRKPRAPRSLDDALDKRFGETQAKELERFVRP